MSLRSVPITHQVCEMIFDFVPSYLPYPVPKMISKHIMQRQNKAVPNPSEAPSLPCIAPKRPMLNVRKVRPGPDGATHCEHEAALSLSKNQIDDSESRSSFNMTFLLPSITICSPRLLIMKLRGALNRKSGQ